MTKFLLVNDEIEWPDDQPYLIIREGADAIFWNGDEKHLLPVEDALALAASTSNGGVVNVEIANVDHWNAAWGTLSSVS